VCTLRKRAHVGADGKAGRGGNAGVGWRVLHRLGLAARDTGAVNADRRLVVVWRVLEGEEAPGSFCSSGL
jgi:hypothetical protein